MPASAPYLRRLRVDVSKKFSTAESFPTGSVRYVNHRGRPFQNFGQSLAGNRIDATMGRCGNCFVSALVQPVPRPRITRSNSSTSISLTVRSAAVVSKSTQPVFRGQASPSNSGPELNSPSREMRFCRAGTEPARSALHFPDPRLFAIASSLHLNSTFVVLRGWILQLTFHVSFVV